MTTFNGKRVQCRACHSENMEIYPGPNCTLFICHDCRTPGTMYHPKAGDDLTSWIKTVVERPWVRLPPLCFHGRPDVGKSFAIEFLTGWFLPYRSIYATHTNESNIDFVGAVICTLKEAENWDRWIAFNNSEMISPRATNYTHWIVESAEPVKDAVNIHLECHRIGKPHVDAKMRGRMHRQTGEELNVHRLIGAVCD